MAWKDAMPVRVVPPGDRMDLEMTAGADGLTDCEKAVVQNVVPFLCRRHAVPRRRAHRGRDENTATEDLVRDGFEPSGARNRAWRGATASGFAVRRRWRGGRPGAGGRARAR